MLNLLVFVSCIVIIVCEIAGVYSRTIVTMALAEEGARAKRINDEMQVALETVREAVAAIQGDKN